MPAAHTSALILPVACQAGAEPVSVFFNFFTSNLTASVISFVIVFPTYFSKRRCNWDVNGLNPILHSSFTFHH